MNRSLLNPLLKEPIRPANNEDGPPASVLARIKDRKTNKDTRRTWRKK